MHLCLYGLVLKLCRRWALTQEFVEENLAVGADFIWKLLCWSILWCWNGFHFLLFIF